MGTSEKVLRLYSVSGPIFYKIRIKYRVNVSLIGVLRAPVNQTQS